MLGSIKTSHFQTAAGMREFLVTHGGEHSCVSGLWSLLPRNGSQEDWGVSEQCSHSTGSMSKKESC